MCRGAPWNPLEKCRGKPQSRGHHATAPRRFRHGTPCSRHCSTTLRLIVQPPWLQITEFAGFGVTNLPPTFAPIEFQMLWPKTQDREWVGNGVGGARSGSWWRNGAGAGGGAGCVDGDEPTRWGIRRVTGAVLDEAVRGRLERHRSVSYNWHRVPPMI